MIILKYFHEYAIDRDYIIDDSCPIYNNEQCENSKNLNREVIVVVVDESTMLVDNSNITNI